jgi:GTPase
MGIPSSSINTPSAPSCLAHRFSCSTQPRPKRLPARFGRWHLRPAANDERPRPDLIRTERTQLEKEQGGGTGPTRAAVILPWEKAARDGAGANPAAEARLAEAAGLAASIGLVVVHTAIVPLRARRSSTLLGEGQVGQQGYPLREQNVEVVIVDSSLTPVQQRNLEREWGCKVIDRTGLILDIFGERAATREGTLQVELAHLEYQRSRLVRSWTHLERQRGGFGFLGGPGETQIEADRRLIGDRIVRLKKELEQVRRTRGLHRSARRRVPFPVVALVGYTNAGKSTLFNALTGAEVVARDQLFATLDPTMRGLRLPSGRRVILSDTVGFISDLPHELVAAFLATLEEVAEADVILHVRDAAHPETAAQRADVLKVLDDMVADGMLDADYPSRVVEVYNKADLLGGISEVQLRPGGAAVSAITGEGLQGLRDAIDARIASAMETADYDIPPQDGASLAWLYQHGEVVDRRDADAAVHVTVRLLPADRARFERRL